AIVNVELPHNLTTLVVMAKTITQASQVGQAEAEWLVTKQVVVRPSVPNYLVQGDKLEFLALVNNYTSQQQEFEVNLAGDGFEVSGERSKRIIIPSPGQELVSFQIQAQQVESLEIVIKATAAETAHLDEVKVPIKLISPLVKQTEDVLFRLQTNQTQTIAYSGQDDPRDYLQLELKPSLADSLYFAYYPYLANRYDSTPEKVETLLTNQTYYQFAQELGLQEQQEQIAEAIRLDALALEEAFRPGEGWGYFDYDATSLQLSAQAGLALARAWQAGLLDDYQATRADGWAAYLSSRLHDSSASLDDKAVILYVMALMQQGDLISTQALADQANYLLSSSVASLALALQELGDSERARGLITSLEDRWQKEGDLLYLSDQPQSYQTSQTPVYQTSLVLQAYAELGIRSPEVFQMAYYLNQARRDYGWNNAFESSQILRSLAWFAVVYENQGQDYDYELYFNEELILAGRVEQGRIVDGESSLRLGVEKFDKPANTVRLSGSVPSGMYLKLEIGSYQSQLPPSSNISLQRVFRGLDLAEKTEFQLGELAIMELAYDGTELEDSAYSYNTSLIEAYLPAGFEIADIPLANSSQADRQLARDIYEGIPCAKQQWIWPQNYEHYLAIRLYQSLPNLRLPDWGCGYEYPRVMRVLVRASFAGEFGARPAFVNSQVIPNTFAYTKQQAIVIK
ncbi:MAG TPA: hypothetical protein ENN77_01205, partial [Candidatus Wirthbacteria bacterium]|nr:hypothetical protein [Candidatus Wirthbacteria bacterium]